MTEEKNRREFTRARTGVTAEVCADGGAPIVSRTTDVSLKGLYLACNRGLPVGSRCRVVLFLDGGEGGVQIEASGTVARADEGGIGIELTAVDLESLEHLRNLVRYNADDVGRVEAEFEGHLGLKRRDS